MNAISIAELTNKKTIQSKTNALKEITLEMLEKYDVAGPRYTSYPTADRFVDAFGVQDYQQALDKRRIGGMALPLSIYVHVPFCESLCFYCACNKIITKRHERGTEYLEYLRREMDLHLKHLGKGQTISQLHLGGGSPTFFNDEELTQFMDMIKRNFLLAPHGEYSIEIDPRTVDAKRLGHLAYLGFNRLSFGVQDFNAEVQKAVHRIQPAEQVFDLVGAARSLGFDSVNVDLIYGLPKQTPTSFARTLEQVAILRPERIALYAYAHLPQRFKPQRKIHAEDLPAAANKIEMLSIAISTFLSAGYVYVGMDHFALPTDPLAIAKRQGRLHRNFQGYSTQPDCDLIALGVSSIGRVGSTYSQNAKTLDEYYDHINQGKLPVVRGLALTSDDLVRRAVIMALMCQGELQFEAVELAYMIDFKQYFAAELVNLKASEKEGLVIVNDASIEVTSRGWFFVRGIAMHFDRYLQTDQNRARFSKII
jgi:oxygen-independent coproporphyrinogen III oxidase